MKLLKKTKLTNEKFSKTLIKQINPQLFISKCYLKIKYKKCILVFYFNKLSSSKSTLPNYCDFLLLIHKYDEKGKFEQQLLQELFFILKPVPLLLTGMLENKSNDKIVALWHHSKSTLIIVKKY